MIKKIMVKKLLISFLLAIQFLLGSGFFQPVNAQESWYNQGFEQFVLKVFDDDPNEIFGERYTYAQVNWIVHSLTALAMGDGLIQCLKVKNNPALFGKCIELLKPAEGNNSSSLGPILGIAFLGDAIVSTRPMSGVDYTANLAKKFHIVPEAHAQGFGFESLQPVQTIWKASRNTAYLLLIIATVATAFIIMFRVRVSPQIVATIQSTLPQIVLTLIIITFSYAIAGFILDLSYLTTGLLALMIKSVGPGDIISHLSVTELFNQFLGLGTPLLSIFLTLAIFTIFVFALGGAISTIGGPFALGGYAIFVGIVLLLLFILWLIFLIRIIWLLLRTLISIILLTVAGPLILIGGLIPGVGGIGNWIRNLIANMAVYPIVIFMTFLAHFFFWGFNGSDFLSRAVGSGAPGALLNPYRINFDLLAGTSGTISVPGLGGTGGGILGIAIATGILALIPHAGNITRSILQGKPFDYGAAIRDTFGPTRAVAGVPIGAAQTYISSLIYNPRDNTGILVDLINRGGKTGRATRQSGDAGGGPTTGPS